MATTTPALPALTLAELSHYAAGWLVDCEIRQHSFPTRTIRRDILDKLLWHLRRTEAVRCGTPELRAFMGYLIGGHTEEGGRWGNPHMTRPVRPRTVDTYHGHLRTFFQWVIVQGGLTASPMALITGPVCRADQIKPFTPDQVEALLAAARCTSQPRRDEAMIVLLLDTGLRASELCGLKHRDLDLTEKRVTVLGKGNKRRSVYFGQRATKMLWAYLGGKPVQEDAPLFPSERSQEKGEHLSRYGLRDMIDRLNAVAGVSGVRCSAHTFRHTFAVSFLRAGGQVYALKEIMGHTDLKMTLKYVALADADLANQRRFSPADQLAATASARGARAWTKTPMKSETPMNTGEGKIRRESQNALPLIPASHYQEIQPQNAQPQKQESQPQKITRAKLTESQVREIKAALAVVDGRSQRQKCIEIATRYRLGVSTVKEIAMGYTWRHIER